MGENKHIEELDAFAKKYMQELEVAKPSIDFTATILKAIEKQENKAVYKVTPLISKKGWFVLVLGLIASLVYVANGKSLKEFGWSKYTPELDWSSLNVFEHITVSNAMVYACFFAMLLIFVQIYFLKNYFVRNIE
ncbi:hypothetical protein [Tenacibaculum sp. 190524A02b]|uniref:Uncharacterized protein n=1 Tax=Tenacibaculum vairaonense TaxID=3137860 RepID=A0ABM9PPD3_9FLAO